MSQIPTIIDSIPQYNEHLGLETIHPLVSVIDLSKAKSMRHQRTVFNFYVIFLKDVKCGDIIYGRQRYDYQEGTVVSLAPGQVIGIEDNGQTYQPRGWALCFDPELIRGTHLFSTMKEYTYFSYDVHEALHLSRDERDLFLDCLNKIDSELHHGTDRLSKRLIANNIELLLNYCLRFYERQFITRQQAADSQILGNFETLLNQYFTSETLRENGLPTVRWCAEQLCLSPNYFGDLVKKETGRTPQEFIHTMAISTAKHQLHHTNRTISEIAFDLGFDYPQHFSRLFKSITGITPNQYRKSSEN
ncbi:MAG: helix-turn-helix domain-containing protein [Paramuribaculum sp.]|nr:helix-turn-helix domain-containing protein [Paramuribaculum sp.]